jgi:Flp pilus assembly protein TadB
MPYTNRSLTFAWLITLALFVASASGVFVGWSFVALLAVAFAAPWLVLRSPAEANTSSLQS